MMWLIVLLAIVVVAVVGVVAYQRGRSAALRRRFGSEYDRVVDARGDRKVAEAELRELVQRRDALDVRPLPPEVRRAYTERWRGVQSRFVDYPSGAVGDADDLVVDVLRERGYPVDDHDEGVALVATDHPDAVAGYRKAHELRQGDDWGSASTDDLRDAFLGFRALFEDLVGTDGDDHAADVPASDPDTAVLPAGDRPDPLEDPDRRASVDRRVRQVRGVDDERTAEAG